MRWLLLALILACAAPASAQEAPPASPPTAPAITSAQIRAALRRYRREPRVARVVAAALRERDASPDRVGDAMDRARITGLLPTVTGTVRRGQGIDLRGLASEDEITNVSTDDDLTLEARMIFRFDRLVFAPEEVGLLRELRAVEEERARIARAVVGLYFERRRLQLERDLAAAPDLAREVRILEIEGLLDAFTGGAFNRMMGGRAGTSSSPLRGRDRR